MGMSMASKQTPFLISGRNPLKFGMEGSDVFALQRALKKAGFRKRKAARHYGFRCRRNVKRLQKHFGLQATGKFGKQEMRHLRQYYDGYGVYLIKQQQKRTTQATKVHAAVKAAFFLLAHKDATHYTQNITLRAYAILHRVMPPNVPKYLDCSAACIWYRLVGGLSDPAGYDYRAVGNSWSMREHGHHTASPVAGDFTFYANPDHVVIEVGQGYVISDGSEDSPYYLKRNYRPPNDSRHYA